MLRLIKNDVVYKTIIINNQIITLSRESELYRVSIKGSMTRDITFDNFNDAMGFYDSEIESYTTDQAKSVM